MDFDLTEEQRLLQDSVSKLLAWVGYTDESIEPRVEVSLDEVTPENRAVKRRVSAFYLRAPPHLKIKSSTTIR